MVDITPEGKGGPEAFDVNMEAGKAFPRHYRYWRRSFYSENPGQLTITDEYSLMADCGCDGVDFLWNTMLPVSATADEVAISGREGTVRIAVPEGSSCEVERLPAFGGAFHNQILFHFSGQSGTIQVNITLE